MKYGKAPASSLGPRLSKGRANSASASPSRPKQTNTPPCPIQSPRHPGGSPLPYGSTASSGRPREDRVVVGVCDLQQGDSEAHLGGCDNKGTEAWMARSRSLSMLLAESISARSEGVVAMPLVAAVGAAGAITRTVRPRARTTRWPQRSQSQRSPELQLALRVRLSWSPLSPPQRPWGSCTERAHGRTRMR